jgi:hypothetical protein
MIHIHRLAVLCYGAIPRYSPCYFPLPIPLAIPLCQFLVSLLLTWNPSTCVVQSRPPWSQVARKLTSPSPFPPHFLPIPISRPPQGFPRSIVHPTKMTSRSRLHIVRNRYHLRPTLVFAGLSLSQIYQFCSF